MAARDQILAGRGDGPPAVVWPRRGRRSRPALIGRTRERHEIDTLLERVRGGRSAALVLRGSAGAGKTALLDHCASQASGFHVARIAGVESEMELPFAALHQLCAPILEHLDALPASRRRALRVAFGLSVGDAQDRLAVASAVLGLAAEAASERPLLCIVDDAHWLDTASAQVLGFVARRLGAESVALVFAAMDGPHPNALAGLPELVVGGLEPSDAETLLSTIVGAPLDPRVRERLIAETRGNPLALLELGPVAGATPAPAGLALGVPQDVSGRIEERFVMRVRALGPAARRLLLIAAVEPVGDPVLLGRAAEDAGIDLPRVLRQVEHLLGVGERVTFEHPLVRSAVYRSASPDERSVAHLAVARVTDPGHDADRRAWHLAAAAREPDDAVAAELERSAGRAQARGGYAAAAAFLQRSVALTRDPARRTTRALAAAEASLRAGAFDDARQGLIAAGMGSLDDFDRGRAELLRGQIAFAAGFAADASARLFRAAALLESLDPALARESYLGALGAALFGGPACAGDLAAVARAVHALDPPAGDRRAIDVLLDGFALLITSGRAAAAPTLLEAAAAFAGDGVPTRERLCWGWMAAAGSNALWDDAGLRAVCRRHLRLARQAGALEHLPIHLIALGTAAARGGDFATASSLIAESEAVAEVTGTRLAPFAVELILASLWGSETDFKALKQAAVEQAASSGQDLPMTVADWSEAVLYNGFGRYEQALAAARRATAAAGGLYAAMWALPELIEAAARQGEADLAQEALERLAATTRPAGTDYGLGVEARSRALLSDDEAAEERFREAIERLGRTEMRSDLARAHLLYGEWLRRTRRRTDAREQLRAAHALFADAGMAAFAERARRELLVSGETARKRGAPSRDGLTPQEAQVAGLARDGLSNAEIAARLFLSSRTVEWHLKHVFAKLGIGSRQRLREALPGGPDDASA